MIIRSAHMAGLVGTALLLSACTGSTLPLAFVDKTSVGIDIGAPNPAEAETGHLVIGFKTKSAAVVPVAVSDKETTYSNGTGNPQGTGTDALETRLLTLQKEIDIAATSGKNEEKEEKEKEKDEILRIIHSKRKFNLIQSWNGDRTDALSVLGQFGTDVDGPGKKVGLGRFFATGTAASVLAEGFAAKLGAGHGIPKANEDTYETEAGKKLTGVSVLANDSDTEGAKVAIQVPPGKGDASFAPDTGDLTYEPGAAKAGEVVTFFYAVTSRMGTSSAKVTIKVTAATVTPAAAPAAAAPAAASPIATPPAIQPPVGPAIPLPPAIAPAPSRS